MEHVRGATIPRTVAYTGQVAAVGPWVPGDGRMDCLKVLFMQMEEHLQRMEETWAQIDCNCNTLA